MEALLTHQTRGKLILAALLLFIIALFIGFFRLITGSLIAGALIFLACMYFLLRAIGVFVMYPGSSFYTRSDIEIRMSGELSSRMVLFFNSLHFLHLSVIQRKFLSAENKYDFVIVVANHIQTMKEVLGMFQDTLSPRKKQMLAHYRQIEDIIEEKQEEDDFSIRDFLSQPRVIDSLDEPLSLHFRQKFERIQNLLKDLHSTIKSYSPPSGTFASLKFKIFEENLYEMRFAFHTWGSAYNFELFQVKTSEDDQIETTIIHNTLRKNYLNGKVEGRDNPSKKTILFCNPNGVFIQFFGFDNEYIRNYLRMGYNVILWNYRGYGQSTGSPSILKSQVDASNVFNFYREKGYDIQIVHGYSIGGAAAVGLFERITAESLASIKILIIDRSFSSIGEMSIEFGPALHNITKLLFLGDNIDLSKQFELVRCRKLLIWDTLDEVIPDRASFKNRIIKRKRGQSKTNSIYGFDEDLQVNQLNEDDTADPDFENLTQKLAFTILKLLEEQLKLDSHQEEGLTEKEEMTFQKGEGSTFSKAESSTQSCQSNISSADSIEYLVRIVNQIDGGGIELLNQPAQMKAMVARRPDKFHHMCESYVLGLVCYGSYFPIGPFIHDHKKIKEQTLQKLERTMSKLQDHFGLEVGQASLMFQKEGSAEQLVRNMYHIYFKLHQLVTDHFSEEWFTLHGSLLPTHNGHNSSLAVHEIRILNDFIKVTIPQELQEQEGQQEHEGHSGQYML